MGNNTNHDYEIHHAEEANFSQDTACNVLKHSMSKTFHHQKVDEASMSYDRVTTDVDYAIIPKAYDESNVDDAEISDEYAESNAYNVPILYQHDVAGYIFSKASSESASHIDSDLLGSFIFVDDFSIYNNPAYPTAAINHGHHNALQKLAKHDFRRPVSIKPTQKTQTFYNFQP